jgi:rhombotail lipoprotein
MFKTSKSIAWGRLAPLALASLAFSGCASTTRNATSVVDYLYPNSDRVETPSVPTLTLPLRVGIAFVPGASSTTRSAAMLPSASMIYRPGESFVLTEKRKQDLMQEVANHFKKYPFIKEIEPIPSAYLTPRGSFANLDQFKTMYGISAIVLLSYDQTQFTDEGALSLAYWTIVGAYVVKGEKNDTHTMLDAVVYDIPSRKMLFRAPGTSMVKGSATPINLGEQQRADSEAGLSIAAKEMIANLDLQLGAFQEKVKERPAEYRVQASSEYRRSGGGDFDALSLALLAVLCGGLAWTRRRP